jgi:hypothetical protein
MHKIQEEKDTKYKRKFSVFSSFLISISGNISYGFGNISYRSRNISYGFGNISYRSRNISYGFGNISYRSRNISYRSRNISYGFGNISLGSKTEIRTRESIHLKTGLGEW